MATPNNPTLTEIVTEGLNKSGDADPDTDLITRASDYWMEEIKNTIRYESPKLAYLQITSIGVLIKGQSRYAYPTDFGSDLSIVLLDGGTSGTAQAGFFCAYLASQVRAAVAAGSLYPGTPCSVR